MTTLYAIITRDAPGSDGARAAHKDGHIAHFRAHKDKIALSGPLTTEAGQSGGSLVVFAADSVGEARAFIEADPYYPAGVWREVIVEAFKASIVDQGLLGQQ